MLGRHVQLPAQLTDIGDSEGRDRRAADRDPAPGGEGEGLVRQVFGRRFGQDLERLVSFDRDRLNVWLRTELYGSQQAKATLAAIEAYLAAELADLDPRVTGTLVLLFRSSDEIAKGQVRSLLLALVLVVGMGRLKVVVEIRRII